LTVIPPPLIVTLSNIAEGRRKKEEGRRKKEEVEMKMQSL
jgi:hypothetical protein